MKAPTGKLAFAYQTIANLEARIAELESRPPAPVAVVLPERMPIPDQATFNGGNAYYAKFFDEARSWNACLEKVKELNQ